MITLETKKRNFCKGVFRKLPCFACIIKMFCFQKDSPFQFNTKECTFYKDWEIKFQKKFKGLKLKADSSFYRIKNDMWAEVLKEKKEDGTFKRTKRSP